MRQKQIRPKNNINKEEKLNKLYNIKKSNEKK